MQTRPSQYGCPPQRKRSRVKPATTRPLTGFESRPEPVAQTQLAESFLAEVRRRRSVRSFSDAPVTPEVIQACIRAAASGPSGANQQPWQFVAVSNQAVKSKIRVAAEQEEAEFYAQRAPQPWLDALAPIGTDAHKPFLEHAPWLIAIFAETHGLYTDGKPKKHYYVSESVGIATGILITALNHCGLATLTHTPSPMKFLNEILGRPSHERPFLLLVVGFPSEDCQVPAIEKKSLAEVATFIE